MLTTARRLGCLTAAAVSASVLALPALPAQAVVTGAPQLFTVVATDGDPNTGYGLVSQTPSGTQTTIVPQSADRDVLEVSASHDGTRIITVEDDYSGAVARTQVVVRDVSGRLVRVLANVPASETSFTDVLGPELSPDGSTAVWTEVVYSQAAPNGVTSLRRASVASGAPATISGGSGLVFSAFLDDTTLIAAHGDTGVAVTVPLAGGTASDITNAPVYSNEFTVSPDGTRLAWSTDHDPHGTGTVSVADVYVAGFTLAGGVATVDPSPVALTSVLDNTSPVWLDSSTIDFVRSDGNVGDGTVFTAPADGSSAAVSTGSVGDAISLAVGLRDGTAPGEVTTLPAMLAGTAVTLRWTLPADLDVSGVLVNRYLGTSASGTPQRSNVFVPASATSLNDTGLVVGQTYTYTFRTLDRSDNVSAAVLRNLTAATADGTSSDPTSTAAAKTPFRVTFAPGAAASIRYTVDYRVNTSPTFTRWLTSTTSSARIFGTAASTGIAATTAVAGNTYRFRVTAVDAFGNSTATVVAKGYSVVPYDQTKATLSGGRNVAHPTDFLGTVRMISTTKEFARVSVSGSRIQVIGERCTTCGVFDVYDGATRVARVDSRAASTQYRQVLYTRTYAAISNHTLTIRPLATAKRPNVILDAFAVRR